MAFTMKDGHEMDVERNYFDLRNYHYELPADRIAQCPASPRDACRLLKLDRHTGAVDHKKFVELLDYLRPGDLLVRNDTRVMASRLIGQKVQGSARVEILLLRPFSSDGSQWEGLVKPGRKLPPGSDVDIDGVRVKIGERQSEDGVRLITFPKGMDVRHWCQNHGSMPLPPYITSRSSSDEDYQTVYSKDVGSAAAPTAGLHFTQAFLEKISSHGIEIADVTLEVGLGTFRPVKEFDIRHHIMHHERCRVPEKTLAAVRSAKQEGRRIIAVGTTVVRTLEGLWATDQIDQRWFETNLFIYPGYRFQVIDGLLTNFHLPGSTLLMLVSAFGNYDFVMAAYREAVKQRYRFFSFGDAMLLI